MYETCRKSWGIIYIYLPYQLVSRISSSPTIQNFFQVDTKILYSSCEQLPNPLPSGEEIQRRIADGILGMLVSHRTTRGLSKSQVVVDCRDKPHGGSMGRLYICVCYVWQMWVNMPVPWIPWDMEKYLCKFCGCFRKKGNNKKQFEKKSTFEFYLSRHWSIIIQVLSWVFPRIGLTTNQQRRKACDQVPIWTDNWNITNKRWQMHTLATIFLWVLMTPC